MRQRGYLIPVKFKPDDEVGDQRALDNSPSYGQEDFFCHEGNVVVGTDLCYVVGLEGNGFQGLFSNSCNDELVMVFVVLSSVHT